MLAGIGRQVGCANLTTAQGVVRGHSLQPVNRKDSLLSVNLPIIAPHKKIVDIVLISPWKHILWYSLEAPKWGTSNEYQQHIFSNRNKETCFPGSPSYPKLCRVFFFEHSPGVLPVFKVQFSWIKLRLIIVVARIFTTVCVRWFHDIIVFRNLWKDRRGSALK